LGAVPLPEGAQVTVMYFPGEPDDVDLHESLDGLSPRIVHAKGARDQAVAAEAWRLFTGAEETTEDI